MAFRFRKRIQLLPGLWLNLGKNAISTSVGGDGVTVNYGKRGTRTTLSVPGTGLSYSSRQRLLFEPSSNDAPRRSGPATRALAVVLWIFLIGYLIWVTH
jgi:hypothetical protein